MSATPSSLPTRSNGTGIQSLTVTIPALSATTFEEIPMSRSLPRARSRDVMNESFKERLYNDLSEYLSELHTELVRTMDSKKDVFDDIPGRDELLKKIGDEEVMLSEKIESIKKLLDSM